MAGLKRSKRVSWPTGRSLCEVRFFLPDDAPFLSGLGSQDHLHAKSVWLLHAEGSVDSDDSQPPGFEAQHKQQPKIETSQIPLIKWQCPLRFVLNSDWGVVAGEESEAVAIEEERQQGILEEFYPHPFSLNPRIAPEVQLALVNDSCTPLVPLIEVEDEAMNEQSDTPTPPTSEPVQFQSLSPPASEPIRLQSLSSPASEPIWFQSLSPPASEPVRLQSLSNNRTPQLTLQELEFNIEQLNQQSNAAFPMPSLSHNEKPMLSSASPAAEPDVLAAASAAFTAIMMSSEEGNLVDPDLLIEILSNPSMLEMLVSDCGAPKQTTRPLQSVASTSSAPSVQPLQIASCASVSAPTSPFSTLTASISAPGATLSAAAPYTFQSASTVPPTAPNLHVPVVRPVKAPGPNLHVPVVRPTDSPCPNLHVPVVRPIEAPAPNLHVPVVRPIEAPAPNLHVPVVHPIEAAARNHVPVVHPVKAPAPNRYVPVTRPIETTARNLHVPVVRPVKAPTSLKDENYFKSLIKLHGGDKQKPLEQQQHPVQRSNMVGYHDNVRGMSKNGELGGLCRKDPVGEVPRPCTYFNTPGGCWRGASCHFQHDASSVPQRIEQHKGATKRIRLDRETLAGRC